jgi:hypothetical protein
VSVTATPTLTLDGLPVPLDRPAGDPSPYAIEELRLTWGRSGVLETPTPATVALTLRDRSPAAEFARQSLIGRLIVLGWSCSDGSSGINFRGRITDAAARPLSGAVAGGGFDVAIAASSLEVDLANYTVAEGTVWPEETFDARRIRIAGLLRPGSFIGGVLLPDRFDLGLPAGAVPGSDLEGLPAAQIDVGGRSALELLRELYASTSPLPMVYDPAADRLTYAARRRFTYSPVGLTISAMLRPSADHGGRFIATSLTGRHLDARRTAYAGALSQQLDSLITHIEVQYLDKTAGYASRTYPAGAEGMDALEQLHGRRNLSVSSIHADRANAGQLAAVLYSSIASHEARVPRLEPVGYSSRREPFTDAAHAAWLLSGHEQSDVAFLGGSWLPQLGQRPLVGILGATVTYTPGVWAVDFAPAPVVIDPSPFTSWAPVTVAASAIDDTVTLADIDPSVTVGDLGSIDVGAGLDPITVTPYKGNPQP